MPGTGLPIYSAGLDGAPVSFHFSSSGLARGQALRRPPKQKTQSRPKADQSTQSSLESPKAFRLYSLNLPSLRLPSGKPLAGDGAPYILARGWMVHPFLFIFPLRGLPGARPQEDRQKEKTQSRPKADQSTQSSLESPKAFRLYSLNLPSLRLPSGKPLAGDGAPYILARGWMVHPFLFIFPLRGLPGARPQEDPQKEKTQSRPKADQSTQSSLESPKAFRLYSLNLPSLRLPSGKPLAGDGAPYILARGWMVHPFLFIFPLRGLPGARPQEDPQKEKTQSRPKADQSTQSSLESPKAFRLYSLNLPSLRLPSGKPLAGDGAPYILARGWMVHPFLFIFPLRGLPGARPQEDPQKEKTQSRPKADQSTQSSLESPKAFRLYSLNLPSLRLPSGKPLAGDGAPYILARGWMVHPFLFIFPLRGLPGARPQEDPQKEKTQSRPKADQSTQSSLESPKAFRLYSLNLPSLRLPSGKPLAGDGAPYI